MMKKYNSRNKQTEIESHSPSLPPDKTELEPLPNRTNSEKIGEFLVKKNLGGLPHWLRVYEGIDGTLNTRNTNEGE